MRTGLVGVKLGMTSFFKAGGERIPVTLVHVDQCQVVSQKTLERDGYEALQLGAFEKKASRVSKALRGHFLKTEVPCKEKLVEFRVPAASFLDVGVTLTADHFVVGQRVDVTGTSHGKGFAGPMKRHNFSGLRASHGVSISHRSHGSTGNRTLPGRVFKNKKMAGQMGNVRVTVQSLEIVMVDADKGILAVKGAIPGAKGSYVLVRDAVKKSMPEGLPFPGAVLSTPTEVREMGS